MFWKSVENLSCLSYFHECWWAFIPVAITSHQPRATSFESITNKKVIDHFTKNNCVNNKQYGFSFSNFTANDLTTITCIISKALDDRFITRTISQRLFKRCDIGVAIQIPQLWQILRSLRNYHFLSLRLVPEGRCEMTVFWTPWDQCRRFQRTSSLTYTLPVFLLLNICLKLLSDH